MSGEYKNMQFLLLRANSCKDRVCTLDSLNYMRWKTVDAKWWNYRASTMREDKTYTRPLTSTIFVQVQTLSGKAITLCICWLQHDMKYLREKMTCMACNHCNPEIQMHIWLWSCNNTCGHLECRIGSQVSLIGGEAAQRSWQLLCSLPSNNWGYIDIRPSNKSETVHYDHAQVHYLSKWRPT